MKLWRMTGRRASWQRGFCGENKVEGQSELDSVRLGLQYFCITTGTRIEDGIPERQADTVQSHVSCMWKSCTDPACIPLLLPSLYLPSFCRRNRNTKWHERLLYMSTVGDCPDSARATSHKHRDRQRFAADKHANRRSESSVRQGFAPALSPEFNICRQL